MKDEDMVGTNEYRVGVVLLFILVVLFVLVGLRVNKIDSLQPKAQLTNSCINQWYHHTYYEKAGGGYCILLCENPAIIKVYDGEEK